MSFTEFEADILEIVNDSELTAGLVRRKIQATIRRMENLWDLPYMFKQVAITAPIGHDPVNSFGYQWKTIKKVGIWSMDTQDLDLMAHGSGYTKFEGFLQKITEEDLVKNHFDLLNDTTAWAQPTHYQVQNADVVDHPLFSGTPFAQKIFRTQLQLYPPTDKARILTLIGYAHMAPYDDSAGVIDNDHWILNYGRDLLEAWTMLSLTPALQDATLMRFYKDLVSSTQEVFVKALANYDEEGLDETCEYVGEGDI
jgi:hypothetical protein